MLKKLICLLAGLTLLIFPGLVQAEQPNDGEFPNLVPFDAPDWLSDFLPAHYIPDYVPENFYIPEDPLEFVSDAIYRTGTPDFDRVKDFWETQEEVFGQGVWYLLDHTVIPEIGPTEERPIIGLGYGIHGYCSVTIDEESWAGNCDIIDRTVEQLQMLGGEDFPIAFRVTTTVLPIKIIEETTEDEVLMQSTEATGGGSC